MDRLFSNLSFCFSDDCSLIKNNCVAFWNNVRIEKYTYLPLTCKNARISSFTSPRLLRQLPSKVHVFDYKSPKFYSHTYNTNEDIQSKLNRKPKVTFALCLSMCNDQISSPLYIEIRTNSARKTLNFA